MKASKERPLTFRVPPEQGGQRLDLVIPACCPGMSRRATRRLIDAGNVFVDGKRLRVSSRPLPAGAEVRIEPLEEAAAPLQEPDVLWMDDVLLLANKPSGMPTEPTRQSASGSLSDRLKRRFVTPSSGESRFLAAANRLDIETSGVVAFARSREAARVLGEAFREGKVERRYLALVHGEVDNAWQVIDLPIGPGERAGLQAIRDDGRPSQTLISVLAAGRDASLLLVTPLTGRTHQIRLHLAHIGHPLFGERRYAAAAAEEPFGLHALSLTVPHPTRARSQRAFAPVPEAFARAVVAAGIDPDILDVTAARYGKEGA